MPIETNFLPNLGEVFEVTSSQVNLFRSINLPGYVIGDIAITAAGATYEWDGDSWNSISIGAGVGGQTPWAQDIQGAGFDLLNVRDITATRNILAEGSLRVLDTTRIGDTDNEWYWKAEDAGMSLYGAGSGGTFKYMSISDPNEGMVLHGSYAFHAAGLDAQQLNLTAIANTSIITGTGYSLTGSNATSLIDLAGTWNTSGNPVALKLAIANTASGATAKFLSFLAGAAGATEVFSVDKVGLMAVGNLGGLIGSGATTYLGSSSEIIVRLASSNQYLFNSTVIAPLAGSASLGASATAFSALWLASSGVATGVTALVSDAANTLALRNGVNAQRARIYNTFTTVDTSGEWLKIDWQVTANQCRIGTVRGTSAGTARVLSIDYGALSAAPTAAITIPITSGAIVFGGGGTFNGNVQAQVGSYFTWNGRSLIGSPADGVITIANVALNDFSRLQFGGTTSSFPSLKRSSTSLICRLADDSADAPFAASTGDFSGAVVVTRYIRTVTGTLAALPAASTAGEGARAFINDGSTTLILGLGLTAAGGGANKVPIYSDGTNWLLG